jgi:hypothetical protein
MNHLAASLIVQISLASGLAGLLWPEKLTPVFDVLMFPWASSYRAVRIHSIGAIAVSILLLAALLGRW